MVRVLICGSRDFDRIDDIKHVINNLNDDDVVIQGCARGADSIAEFLTMKRGLKVIGFPAQWTKYGRRAGSIPAHMGHTTSGRPATRDERRNPAADRR